MGVGEVEGVVWVTRWGGRVVEGRHSPSNMLLLRCTP